MFRNFLIIALAILTVSCNKEPKHDGYIVNASIDASANGKLVSLNSFSRTNPTLLDSARVIDGNLVLKGKVDYPDMYMLTIENIQGTLPIMIENETMDVKLYIDSLQSSLITGSKENDVLKAFQDNAKPLRKQNELLGNKFREAQAAGDNAAMQFIRQTFDSLVNINKERSLKSIENNNSSTTSALILTDLVKSKAIDIQKANSLYANFTDEVKNTRAGKELKELIDASLATEIGSIAPEFSGTTPEGETVALKNVLGKVTIIDFWAAWCGPCRKENPNVVKVYNKYHDNGLEIIGISLDGSSRQNNPKEAWLKAIETDDLNWHHVSSLQYFNDPIAKLYNINSIPATFILDENGKIVAKNLRGQALEQKISELLD